MENEYQGHPYSGEPCNRHEGETAPFVLSILSLVFPAIIGLVLSIIALVKISALRRRGQNGPMVTASLVIAIIGCSLSALITAIIAFLVCFSVAAVTIGTLYF